MQFGNRVQFLATLLEIYFGGDKCRNFGTFCQIAPKIISAENNLRPLSLYVKYPDFQEKRRTLSPPNIFSAELNLRRNISPVRYTQK